MGVTKDMNFQIGGVNAGVLLPPRLLSLGLIENLPWLKFFFIGLQGQFKDFTFLEREKKTNNTFLKFST